MLRAADIVPMPMGHLTAPPEHPLAGRKLFVQAFLIRHPDGLFLFDTGIGRDASLDGTFATVSRTLPEALAEHGLGLGDVRMVANCHLHFDHAGENFRLPGVPNFVQRDELKAGRDSNYTLPALVADFDGASFEEIEGEASPLPGLRLIPTPGHTDGHQTLVVETTEGRVVLAGQALNFASDWAHAAYASASGYEATPSPPAWMGDLLELDPRVVLFAHDQAVWSRVPLAL